MDYDMILRNLESAVYKPEGCKYFRVGRVCAFPVSYLYDDVAKKVVDEHLYDVDVERFTDQIIRYVESSFVVEDFSDKSIDELEHRKFSVYGLVVSMSEELVDNYTHLGIDFVNGMKVYGLMSLFKTLVEFRSSDFTHLKWKLKPSISIRDDFNTGVFNVLAKMCLNVSKQ